MDIAVNYVRVLNVHVWSLPLFFWLLVNRKLLSLELGSITESVLCFKHVRKGLRLHLVSHQILYICIILFYLL